MDEREISRLRIQSRILITDELELPPIVLKVDDTVIATLGNFSASTGKAKSRKTFNVTALAAAALANKKVMNYDARLPNLKNRILYIDTEQSPYHCQLVIKRILKLAGLSENSDSDLFEFLALRKFSPKIRVLIIEEAIKSTANLGLVIIDGVKDLSYDINSPSEATDLISRFMHWTDEYGIHIHTVLHLNKNDENTRGHLGTELNNKAESILQVTKNAVDKDISTVSPMICRDKDFEPFAFSIDDDGVPYMVDEFEVRKSKKTFDHFEVSDEKHRGILTHLFDENEKISYGDLITLLKRFYALEGYEFGDNKAKILKSFLENKNMIVKDGKYYSFNSSFIF